jgi:hypothetical protein
MYKCLEPYTLAGIRTRDLDDHYATPPGHLFISLFRPNRACHFKPCFKMATDIKPSTFSSSVRQDCQICLGTKYQKGNITTNYDLWS